MTKKGAPSKATIQSWRKEFALVLVTSTVRVGWLNLITTCNIMRCKDGHIVEDTAMLVTKRGLKCSISANAALEAAEEVNLTYNDNTRTLSFEGLVSTVSSKVESECMRDVEDREIACALYVASSWFSTDGPRADEGKDFVWGNRHIETKDNSEIVQWLPKTMGVLHMAGWRVVPTINVSGEYELYTPTERLWGRSRWLSTEKDRPLEETDWREFRSLAMERPQGTQPSQYLL